MADKQRIAVVRVRGRINMSRKTRDTLNMLKLYKKNHCVVVPNTNSYLGMINKVKDYVTFGPINQETFTKLLKKRGKITKQKELTEDYVKKETSKTMKGFSKDFMNFKKELKDITGLKPFFRLKPPEKGFERKGIKKPYSIGGALGYRGKGINDLIERML